MINMPKDQHTTLSISTGTFLRAASVVMGIWFLYYIRDIVAILLISVVIASAIEPGVRRLVSFRIPRVGAVLLIYVFSFSLVGAVFYFVIPPTIGQIEGFIAQFPLYLENTLRELQKVVVFLPADIAPGSIADFTGKIDLLISTRVQAFFSPSSLVFDGPLAVVFAIIISFYLAVQEDGVGEFLRIITPARHEEYIVNLWRRSQRKIGRWFQGQILLGALVGVLVFSGLTILGVQYALALAVFSALFEIIPYFGPIMAAIPGIAVAAVQDPLLGLWVALLYFVVQQLENHLIYPVVVRKTVGVPPLLVIVSLLIGVQIGGFFGIVLAVPLAVVVVEFLNDVVEKKKIFQTQL